eukprot:2742-Heterococcus_DN1.PRE.2
MAAAFDPQSHGNSPDLNVSGPCTRYAAGACNPICAHVVIANGYMVARSQVKPSSSVHVATTSAASAESYVVCQEAAITTVEYTYAYKFFDMKISLVNA